MNGRAAIDELGHDAAEDFNTEQKRNDVEEKNVGDVAIENTGLGQSTDRNGLIGVGLLRDIRRLSYPI